MFRVPEHLPIEEAPVLELVIAACRALMQVPPDTYGRRLTICGLGPSGLVLLQYARLLGYKKIVGWDLYQNRRELALTLGIDEAYDPRERLEHAPSPDEESDVAVDMTGDDLLEGEPTFTRLLRTIRPNGLVVTYGHPQHGRHFDPFVFQSRNLTMRGPVNDMEVIREKGRDVMKAVADGGIRIAPLITKVIDFDSFDQAFERLLDHPDDQIKVIMKWHTQRT